MLREVFQTKILQFSFIRGVLEGGCPRFWAILGVKRGKIACFGKKKLLFFLFTHADEDVCGI